MRAWQTVKSGRPADALVLNEDVAPPEPGPGTLLLEVLAAGIGLPDAFMCQGSYALTPSTLPFTQGQEVVGRIVGWGEGVENRRVGDRVMAVTSFFTGDGSFAEQCLALDAFCLPVPDEMTDAEGAAFTIPFHTAYLALSTRGQLAAGETLVVIGGAGGTGSAAVQVGKALGARVIATAGGAEKCDVARRAGADETIDYSAEDFVERVKQLTGGKGADVIYDSVGGDVFDKSLKCIAWNGRLLVIGFASGVIPSVVPQLVRQRRSEEPVLLSDHQIQEISQQKAALHRRRQAGVGSHYA